MILPYPIIIYSDKDDKCTRKLVKYLDKKGYLYTKYDINSEESKIALKYHSKHNSPAPLLQLGKSFFCGETLIDRDTMKLQPAMKKWISELAILKNTVPITCSESTWPTAI